MVKKKEVAEICEEREENKQKTEKTEETQLGIFHHCYLMASLTASKAPLTFFCIETEMKQENHISIPLSALGYV